MHIFRSLSWLEDERKFLSGGTDFFTRSSHLKTGSNIIIQASDLIKSLEQLENFLINSKPALENSFDMLFAHCLCLKMGILRLFAHSPWQDAPLSREGLHGSRVREYAISALGYIENRFKNTRLEAVIYITHLVAIALEIQDIHGRRRILSLFRMIKSKGFELADTYMLEVQLAWKAVGPAMPMGEL